MKKLKQVLMVIPLVMCITTAAFARYTCPLAYQIQQHAVLIDTVDNFGGAYSSKLFDSGKHKWALYYLSSDTQLSGDEILQNARAAIQTAKGPSCSIFMVFYEDKGEAMLCRYHDIADESHDIYAFSRNNMQVKPAALINKFSL